MVTRFYTVHSSSARMPYFLGAFDYSFNFIRFFSSPNGNDPTDFSFSFLHHSTLGGGEKHFKALQRKAMMNASAISIAEA